MGSVTQHPLGGHLRRPAGLARRFFQHSGRLYPSGVSLAELYDWVKRHRDPDPLRASVQKLLTYEVSLIPFDINCARRVRTREGRPPAAGNQRRQYR